MIPIERYVNIKTSEYAHMAEVILSLREQKQKAREFLEKNMVAEALEELKKENV